MKSSIFYFVAILIIGGALGLHFAFFHGGYLGYDELEYCKLGSDLADNSFTHDNLYAYRYAAFVPLSLLYLIFGIDDFANFLYQFLILAYVCWLLLDIVKDKDKLTQWIGLIVLVFTSMHLLYLEKPMADFAVELGFFMAFIGYYRQRYMTNFSDRAWRNATLFITGSILIFLAKETFLVLYPFFLILMLYDLYHRRHLLFWQRIVSILVGFIILYFSAYHIFMGNALARVDAIFTNRYISDCTYELQPTSIVVKRILYVLWVDFIRSGFMIPLIGFGLFFGGKVISNQERFVGLSWIALLLLANFMTISYTAYVPLCNDPRHFIFILPVGAFFLVQSLSRLSEWKTSGFLFSVTALMIQLGVSIYFGQENTYFLYIPLILAFLTQMIWKQRIIFTLLFSLGIGSIYVQNSMYNREANHKGTKELLIKIIEQKDFRHIVVTDGANARIGDFFNNYQKDKVNFVPFDSLSTIKQDTVSKKWVIINGMTLYLSSQKWEKLPQEVQTAHEKLPIFFKNRSGTVYMLSK